MIDFRDLFLNFELKSNILGLKNTFLLRYASSLSPITIPITKVTQDFVLTYGGTPKS